MRALIEIPAEQFNLVMHGRFDKATDKDLTILMRSFNNCTVIKEGEEVKIIAKS